MSNSSSGRQGLRAVQASQARMWLGQADEHYQRAALLADADATMRRAELELELARYAKERAEDLLYDADRPAGTDLTY